jgi:glycosyltransferase involved in cell wall biosynthesis
MISIVIPCFNCESFIERAFNSVLNQTFKNWELLLVDNNSTDDTQNVLIALQTRFPEKIKVLFEERAGAPFARNKGLWEAKGDWVQFLDADDEIKPDKLEVQYAIAVKKNPAFIASTYTRVGSWLDQVVNETRSVYPNDVWSALISSYLGITSSNLFNRKLLLEVKGWDESLMSSQEYNLMFKLLKVSTAVEFDTRDTTIVHVSEVESISRGFGREKRLKVLELKIDLRFRIKAYLTEHNLLTPDRKKRLDLYLFEHITKTYRYTSDITRHLRKLDVPFKKRIRSIYFMRTVDLQRLFGKEEAPLKVKSLIIIMIQALTLSLDLI